MKKIIAIIISVIFILSLSIPSFAIEPTGEQISELKEYGIITGDPDGNMRFGDTLTRSEAVKIICTLLCFNENSNIVGIESPFPDVSEYHWAKGYISIAKELKIVEGDPSGNFNPEASVTNEEFIKMLVVALGYEPIAESRGGYPVGYNMVASNCGITEGLQFEVNTPALRGEVAIMTVKALDVPLMKQVGFGTNAEYAVMDGKNGMALETLRDNFEK